MLRFQQFLAEAAIFSALGVLFLIVKHRESRRLAAGILLFCAFFALVFGLWGADRLAYTSDEWQEYLRFNAARTELVDYGIPAYASNEEAYLELGMDNEAMLLLPRWRFLDTEKFSTEALEKIGAMKQPTSLSLRYLARFAKNILKGLLHRAEFLIFLPFLLIWLLRGRRGAAQFAAAIYLAAVLAMIYLYLYRIDRYFFDRVDYGIWLAASIVMLFFMEPGKRCLPQWIGGLAFVLILLYAQSFSAKYLWFNRQEMAENRLQQRAVLEEIHADAEHFYLRVDNNPWLVNAYGPWDAIPFGIEANHCAFGGWALRTPPANQILRNYGIENPVRDMIDSECIYLLGTDIDWLVDYLHNWYDASAKPIPVKEIGKYTVYRIVSESGVEGIG